MKLSSALNINLNNIRIREFTMAGQKLRVRVPLASEMEAISKAVDAVDWLQKYAEMSAPFIKDKSEIESEEIKFLDDDIIVDGKSLKELATLTAKTEERITQMIRLLVPANEGDDMNTITYADIDEAFPFAVQMEVMKKIIEVISPGYEETRKN
jgi:hypothetical protein